MRELGRVVRLQIQRSSLKTGEKPHRVYDTVPILTVERLTVSPDGALGEADHGAWIVDVHHRMHPSTKNPDGEHRSEEHTSELQSRENLVCRLLLEKKKKKQK